MSDLCCCCFLLWAEFYTVCQSPERHTLEGPVEWDTKSDPSGEQLSYHLPPQPLCVCLSLSYSLPLLRSLQRCVFLTACPSLFLRPLLFLRLHQQLPRLVAKFERIRSPLFGKAKLHLLTRSVLEWSAKLSQHLPACIAASVQLMNTKECAHTRPLPFCLISFTLNRGTVYNDSARNIEWKYGVRWPWNVCGNHSVETGIAIHTLLWLLRKKVRESHEDHEWDFSEMQTLKEWENPDPVKHMTGGNQKSQMKNSKSQNVEINFLCPYCWIYLKDCVFALVWRYGDTQGSES